MNDSFVFYRSFAEAIENLPAEQYKAIMVAPSHYALDGEEPDSSDPIVKAMLTLMRPQIDANNRRREAGCKGGKQTKATPKQTEASTKQTEASAKQSEANGKQTKATPKQTEANVNVNVNVNANANENVNANANVNELGARVRERFGAFADNVEALTNSPMTEYKKQLVVQKLISLGKTEAEQIALLDEAIRNGWHTVYPKKHTDAKRQETKEEFAERWACV